ncbi:MAG: class I SAM-dependent methyltransferase [Bacteroidota bacterium]
MRQSTKSNWENFWKSRTDVHEVYSNADRILRNLNAVTDPKGKIVLEVGAGTGRDSFGLVKLGAEVVQLDYVESSLAIIRSLSKKEGIRVHIVQGDAFSLPFPDFTFDVVFHQGLLEHFREDEAQKLLSENVRVLKRGGFLLVDVPQRYHIYTVVKHILITLHRWFAGWEREFSVRELERIFQNLGLIPVRRYGEWMYPSLFYRIAREVFKKAGVRLPMYPQVGGVITRLRNRVRETALSRKLALYTSISIGVIGQKG